MPPLERTYTSKLGRNLFRKLPPFRRRHSTKSCQQAGWTHPPQRHRLPEAWHSNLRSDWLRQKALWAGFISPTGVSLVG
jgi:hypothetical protein